MNGLNSFYTLEDGLKHMIGHGLWTRGKKVALFQVDSSNLYSLENGECKVFMYKEQFLYLGKSLLKIVK